MDGAEVPIPADEDGLDWEGEIVAWVGTRLVDATPEEALAAVVGYSTFNDLTSRRAQKLTSQWILGMSDSGGRGITLTLAPQGWAQMQRRWGRRRGEGDLELRHLAW